MTKFHQTDENEVSEKSYIEMELAAEPHLNVVSKEEYEKRIQRVFQTVCDTLARSFGPGGAGTFISIFPAYYNTKDGFTIMKNLAWDRKLDQIISDMILNICNRLNFTVGDGTTTAVVATKSMYDAYQDVEDKFKNEFDILPRDILKICDKYKKLILEELDKRSVKIQSDDPEVLYKNIYDVVNISSNGNQEITDMISNLYKELMYPAISVVKSKDGLMHSTVTKGYNIDVTLTDKVYINNDDNSMDLTSGANVIIFDHKVMKDTYDRILKPLSMDSKARGKHLICIAPFYDETALDGVIRNDLMAEYKKNQDINLVLTVCKKPTGKHRVLMDDLAMLLNTMMISVEDERNMMKALDSGAGIYEIFDLDNRGIPGISVCRMIPEANRTEGGATLELITYNEETDTSTIFMNELKDQLFRIGYASEINISLKEGATFKGFYYDEKLYQKYKSTADAELEEIRKKCETNGAFSLDLLNAQKRVHALGLKTGVIEVGASSELNQGYLKDTVDDAVKAAESAYTHGVVLGCNVTLSSIISELLEKEVYETAEEKEILEMFLRGFRYVYYKVLENRYENIEIDSIDDFIEWMDEHHIRINEILPEIKEKTTVFDYLIELSIKYNQVLDLSKKTFSTEVINSSETDREILTAVIDLLSLLITGNQLVIA